MDHVKCEKTGLSLVPATGQTAYRIAKTSYGPMNPPVRPERGKRTEWGRFDVAGYRTAYAGSTEDCAYAESLAFAKPDIGNVDLSEIFDDEPDGATLLEAVQQEWADACHMRPGEVAAGWRRERLMHQMSLPQSGWFVGIDYPESIAAVEANLSGSLSMAGVSRLTTSHLYGEDRALTTSIAEWVWHQVLYDGSLPHGIVYSSKHGANWRCWAIWLRAMDDGKPVSSEPTFANEGAEIRGPNHNKALKRVTTNFNIHCH